MTINVAILGAGWFGREAHLRNLLRIPDVQVVAVSSRSAESRAAAREIAGPALFVSEDWRDILGMPSIDAVIVALPNHMHCEAAVAALQSGRHVLCEKPPGLTIFECDRILAAADRAGRTLQVGHEMRFQRLYQQMHSTIAAGGVGDPRIVWCREYRGPMRTGWRSSESVTGGLLLEKNCHHFDLFQWLLGSAPVRVMAQGGRDVLLDRELLDNAQVLIEFEGGRRAVLEVCLFAPDGGDCEIGLVGTGGRLDSWNQALRLVHHRFEPKERIEQACPDPDDEAGFRDAAGRVDRGIRAQLVHFLDCCRTGATPLNNGPAARMVVAVCLAAQESIRRQQPVTIEEILHGHVPTRDSESTS